VNLGELQKVRSVTNKLRVAKLFIGQNVKKKKKKKKKKTETETMQ
jgi:hypothetical protein